VRIFRLFLLAGLAFCLAACHLQIEGPETLGSTDEMQTGAADFDRAAHAGNKLYQEHCSSCHDGTVPKAPAFNWIEMLPATVILRSLEQGLMRSQAAGLTSTEKIAIAEYLARQNLAEVTEVPEPHYCGAKQPLRPGKVAAVNWGHDTNRFSPADVAELAASEISRLELKWSFAFPDAFRARSQPAIGHQSLFFGSPEGTVYAMDLETGCMHWQFKASAEVRTAVVLSTGSTNPPLAFFGDILAKLYAVNALTGELVWQFKVDDHSNATLTGTPAYHDGTLYVPVSSLEVIPAANPSYPCCSFRGSLVAIDSETGLLQWRHYTIPDEPKEVGKSSLGTPVLAPSGAPSWSSPTIDIERRLVYIGTGENYSSPAEGNSDAILAINMGDGSRAWTRQSTAGDAWNVACMMEDNPNCPEEDGPDFDHGSSILLVRHEDNSELLLAGHKNGTVYALDPDNEGELIWSRKIGRGSIQGGVHWGMAWGESVLYVPINDMNNTRNGDFLDPDLARPGVHAINTLTGELLWSHVQENICHPNREFCDPGVSAPVTALSGAVFAGHLDGFIRAYDRDSGKKLWEFDSTPEILAINGIMGNGGSISGAGPVIAYGHLVINSGYGLYNHEAGNLLLVFGVADRER
jgi:polyvinyl alcohol dehydrogenase (cytochrome)